MSNPQEDSSYRFQVYLNYVSAISEYLGKEEECIHEHYQDIVTSSKFNELQSGLCNQQDLINVGQFLRNAWLTEAQIRMSNQTEAFISISNHWTPVQLYYSAYLAVRAFICAGAMTVGEKHAKTLRFMASEIYSRPQIFPYPWRVLSDSDPEERKFINLPPNTVVEIISPLKLNRNANFWDRYCQFLKTTRERKLKDCIDEWKHDNKEKKIKAKRKQELINRLAMTSIFDCLYRLRVRSNYQDADAFLLSVTTVDEKRSFHNSAKNINWHILLCLELLIAKRLGKKKFAELIESFEQSNLEDFLFQETVGKRWNFIRQHI